MSLEDALRARVAGDVVLVGMGNPLRGDDGVGCAVAQRLGGVPGLRVIEAEEVPESHLGAIAALRPRTVVLVDAVDLRGPPGSVALLEPDDLGAFPATTHRVPLALLAAWLRREASASVVVVGIQPGSTALGAPLTPVVEAAGARVAAALRSALVDRHPAGGGRTAGDADRPSGRGGPP